MAPWEMPEPLLPVAIVAKTRSDEDALAKNLGRLVAGDPTHAAGAQRRDPPAGAVVHGRGARRRGARPAARRRRRAGHRAGPGGAARDVRRAAPRGTAGTSSSPAATASTRSATSRSSRCRAASGFEFVDKVVGGAVPHNYIPSVEKGVRAQMERGIVAGYPVVDLRVTLFDGKAHSVDSSDAAFQTAGALALRGRRREGPGRRCSSRSTRSTIRVPDAVRRRGDERPVRPPRPGARHRARPGRRASGRWSGPRCRRPSWSATRWSCAR